MIPKDTPKGTTVHFYDGIHWRTTITTSTPAGIGMGVYTVTLKNIPGSWSTTWIYK